MYLLRDRISLTHLSDNAKKIARIQNIRYDLEKAAQKILRLENLTGDIIIGVETETSIDERLKICTDVENILHQLTQEIDCIRINIRYSND